jgi:hypothetical protein
LTRPIEAALNKLPGVRVARNLNIGPVVPNHHRYDASVQPMTAGLGDGSADLVGVCFVPLCVAVDSSGAGLPRDGKGRYGFGRAFCLECKLPGREKAGDKARLADQARWARQVRALGGFCAVVTSVAEALACVDRCRAGLSE